MYLENYNRTIQNIFNILSNNYSFKVSSSFGEINIGSSKYINIINQDDFNFYNKFLHNFLTPVLYKHKDSPTSEKNIIQMNSDINTAFTNLVQNNLREQLYNFYFSQVNNGS